MFLLKLLTKETSGKQVYVHGSFDFKSKANSAGPSQGGKVVAKAPLPDFISKMDIKLADRSGDAGVMLRASHLGNGPDSYRVYYVGISAENNGYGALEKSDNAWRELEHAPMTIDAGEMYTMKIMRAANEIPVFVGGISTPNTGASFDNIELSPVVFDNFEKNMVGWKIYDGRFDASNKELGDSDIFRFKTVLETTFQTFILEADNVLTKAGGGGFIFRAAQLGPGPNAYHG
ncbi:putative glycosyl hydrolase [Metarhizium acridum CQMa 102]|uniref:Putative glycosyl hydrolase n=1 Tax=Metarhizium acridum (strain CQMa 102) TaxID=655827 RepID=E9DUA6_METAQ|nr:putative glycosyl hydrolase [Metarhizium acridum CQMa 102]EFY92568.1 putative glycosyl hydrolase [Metarhizium acridum CQMa 102]